jgi:hypothetical protein
VSVVLGYFTEGIPTGKVPVTFSTGLTVRVVVALEEAPLVSTTFTTTEYGLPVLVVGVPLITPLLLMLRPFGSGAAVQVRVPVPPVALIAAPLVKALPTVAVGKAPAVTTGRALPVIPKVACAVARLTSVAVTVTLIAVVEVGVPLMVPVVLLMLKPVPVKPVAVHVIAPVPPVEASGAVYAVLTVAAGSGDLVVIEIAGFTVRVNVLLTLPMPSFTVMATVVEVPEVGVPVIVPLVEPMLRPVGRPVAVQVLVPLPPPAARVAGVATGGV